MGSTSARPRATTPDEPRSSPPIVFAALQTHWAVQELERARAGSDWEDHGLVFTTSTGQPIEPSNLNRHFATFTNKAGIGHERLHNLRHTAATLLRAYGGADLHDVNEILGHSTIAVTSDLYGHGVPVVQRELMNRVSELFEASGTPRLSKAVSEPALGVPGAERPTGGRSVGHSMR